MSVDDIVVDLLKQGLFEEAETLVEAASGMTEENQARQMRFFMRALAGSGVDLTTLSLDPKKRIMSFKANGFSVLELPKLVESVLRKVNSFGNAKYELGRVRRGYNTVVEIEIH